MKTKLEMAHDWMMKHDDGSMGVEVVVFKAWAYADAMQAEADKRKPSGLPNVLRGACGEIVAVKVDDKEWQPDWSQAPEWANWWAMDGFSEKANWYINKPYLDDDSKVKSEWNIGLMANAKTYIQAPSFNYQGNWQDSLRKRPQ